MARRTTGSRSRPFYRAASENLEHSLHPRDPLAPPNIGELALETFQGLGIACYPPHLAVAVKRPPEHGPRGAPGPATLGPDPSRNGNPGNRKARISQAGKGALQVRDDKLA